MIPLPPHVVALAACAGVAPAATVPDTAGALEAQRAWWHAFTVADTAYVRAHSAPDASLTLSSGQTLGRDGIVGRAATHTTGSQLTVRWSDERVRCPAPTVLVVTSRVTETAGPNTSVYRYLTVLERSGARWRVASAQSTREATLTPRAYAAVAGQVADYVGSYRTPRGLALRIAARDSTVVMIEPSGKELRLEPVGPGVFELPEVSPANGVVRLLFTRDASGRVSALSQLVTGAVNTFPRMP